MSRFPADEFVASSRFQIRRRIGAGGMGIVFEAFDTLRDEIVALKTLRQLDADSIYRLKKEFRALADLVHPNLVRLYDFFSGEEGIFFTMEYVVGVDFLSFVRGPQEQHNCGTDKQAEHSTIEGIQELPPTPRHRTDRLDEITEILDQVPSEREGVSFEKLRIAILGLCDGVACLHHSNRLHRDIKPSNILVTDSGRVVLLDCGLALDANSETNATGAEIAGTYPYMSPEQCVGSRLGPASDWYSVGVVLYEALVGVRPYLGSVMEVITAKRRPDPTVPSRAGGAG